MPFLSSDQSHEGANSEDKMSLTWWYLPDAFHAFSLSTPFAETPPLLPSLRLPQVLRLPLANLSVEQNPGETRSTDNPTIRVGKNHDFLKSKNQIFYLNQIFFYFFKFVFSWILFTQSTCTCTWTHGICTCSLSYLLLRLCTQHIKIINCLKVSVIHKSIKSISSYLNFLACFFNLTFLWSQFRTRRVPHKESFATAAYKY